jgi:hypothetical protein
MLTIYPILFICAAIIAATLQTFSGDAEKLEKIAFCSLFVIIGCNVTGIAITAFMPIPMPLIYGLMVVCVMSFILFIVSEIKTIINYKKY